MRTVPGDGATIGAGALSAGPVCADSTTAPVKDVAGGADERRDDSRGCQ
ncbi:hypothetical protein [Streptomyces xantholiticus]|nr:hypothetical protein [Streptomyces xantholiticus]